MTVIELADEDAAALKTKATAELMAKMPEDGASQHDHYICCWPKREV